MSRGVVYLLSGSLCYEHLAVSAYSLRKFWSGPVYIWTTEGCSDIARSIAFDSRIQGNIGLIQIAKARRQHFHTKAAMFPRGPFDKCVFIDADTVIEGPIDDLFTDRLTLVQMGDMRLNSTEPQTTLYRNIKHRCRVFSKAGPDYMDRYAEWVQSAPPLINTGALGYSPNHPAIHETDKLCREFAEAEISDQLALQFVYPAYPDVTILDDRFNWLFRYSKKTKDDVRIRHYIGMRWHTVKTIRERWQPHFQKAYVANIGGIQDWAGTGNPWLKPMLSKLAG